MTLDQVIRKAVLYETVKHKIKDKTNTRKYDGKMLQPNMQII